MYVLTGLLMSLSVIGRAVAGQNGRLDIPAIACEPSTDFSLVMSDDDMNRIMLSRHWPILRGYETMRATSQDHPIDALLLERIQLNQRLIRKPVVRLKNENGEYNSRDEWKFEKIIHQTWKTEKIPKKLAKFVVKWQKLNPTWTYMFWTDRSARDFMQKHYPALLYVYDAWTNPIQKADMLKIVILYAFGGVFVDIDMEPLKPLDDIRDWSSCVLSREPDMHSHIIMNGSLVWANNFTLPSNAFIACRSHHPFLHYLLSRISKYNPIITNTACTDVQTSVCTGSLFLSVSYGFYLRSISEEKRSLFRELDVIAPHHEYFQPTFDQRRLIVVHDVCRKRLKECFEDTLKCDLTMNQIVLCNDWMEKSYRDAPSPSSFMNHHFLRSHLLSNHRKSTNNQDVRNIVAPLIWSQKDDKFYVDYTVEK